MVDLANIKNANKEDIVSLLVLEQTNEFEIYVPKYTQQFFSEREEIAYDYLRLAFAGQLLNSIEGNIEYEDVSPTEHESIGFTLNTSKIDELAEVLLLLSYGYENGDEEESEIFSDSLYEFLDETPEEQIICSEFIDYFKEFSQEEDSDENEEENL